MRDEQTTAVGRLPQPGDTRLRLTVGEHDWTIDGRRRVLHFGRSDQNDG